LYDVFIVLDDVLSDSVVGSAPCTRLYVSIASRANRKSLAQPASCERMSSRGRKPHVN